MSRADRLEAVLHDRELGALIVTNLVNVRYLTGYTGTNGVCIVGEGRRVFLTDFRYVTQAAREVDGFDREQGRQDLLEDAAAHLSGRVGFEDAWLSVRSHTPTALVIFPVRFQNGGSGSFSNSSSTT